MEIWRETIHECKADRIDFECVWCIQKGDYHRLIMHHIPKIIAEAYYRIHKLHYSPCSRII